MRKPKITRRYLTRGGLLNEKFQKLSNSKKRVAIARDALRWLKSGAIKSTSGTYMTVRKWPKRKSVMATEPIGVDLLVNASCEVCAKGALFLATVMRTNKTTLGKVVHSDSGDMCTKVCGEEDIFTDAMFDLIEGLFEDSFFAPETDLDMVWNNRFPPSCNYNSQYSKSKFDNEEYRDKMRLAAILVNIIQHNGELVVSEVPTVASVKRYLANA